MKLTYKNFEHRTKILDPFYRDPGMIHLFHMNESKFNFLKKLMEQKQNVSFLQTI